jgi:hypothetical protein
LHSRYWAIPTRIAAALQLAEIGALGSSETGAARSIISATLPTHCGAIAEATSDVLKYNCGVAQRVVGRVWDGLGETERAFEPIGV